MLRVTETILAGTLGISGSSAWVQKKPCTLEAIARL